MWQLFSNACVLGISTVRHARPQACMLDQSFLAVAPIVLSVAF